MIMVLLAFALHVAKTDSTVCILQVDPPSKQVNFPAQITGRLLDYCVRAGMTPDQVSRVFGEPEGTQVDSQGPITESYTNVTYIYLRYGVMVFFPPKPNLPMGRTLQGPRVHGGIE
ncbi:MAG: hypothetical protein JO112_19060 [Planctomycetes bacterium]|nr:hypothetical protein [Planctomycetota bacterium]